MTQDLERLESWQKRSENAVEVRKRDRVMAIGLIFEKEVMRIICACEPQSGRPDIKNVRFYD